MSESGPSSEPNFRESKKRQLVHRAITKTARLFPTSTLLLRRIYVNDTVFIRV